MHTPPPAGPAVSSCRRRYAIVFQLRRRRRESRGHTSRSSFSPSFPPNTVGVGGRVACRHTGECNSRGRLRRSSPGNTLLPPRWTRSAQYSSAARAAKLYLVSNLCITRLPINSPIAGRVGANCHLSAAYHLAVRSSPASPLQPFKPIKVWGCITTHSLSASSHGCSVVCGKSQSSSLFLDILSASHPPDLLPKTPPTPSNPTRPSLFP